MPKKFKGENSKAVEARARKSAAKAEEAERTKKAQEDTLWTDDDKALAKKAQRKEEREQKKNEQAEKKKQLTQLYEAEMEAVKDIKPASATALSANKLTRHQIEQHRKMVEAEEAAQRKQESKLVKVADDPIEENLNKLQIEGEARSVDAAISVLGQKPTETDKNPEKRMKAAYQAFEDKRLPQLKAEHTNLRLSQIKQILRKEWQKSPDNPFNAVLS